MMHKIVLILYSLVAAVLAAATVLEKINGTDIYSSPLFVVLWGVFALCGVAWIIYVKAYKKISVLLIHIALLVILLGALVTYLTAQRGNLHLRLDKPHSQLVLEDARQQNLPFEVELELFDVLFYQGTTTPMDYVSVLKVENNSYQLSINKPIKIKGYRFCQLSFDDDYKGATFLVTKDSAGTMITYFGYGLLFFALLFMLINPKGRFRKLLGGTTLALMLCVSPLLSANNAPKTISNQLASDLGSLAVYYNGRITPLQTLAQDFAVTLCGSTRYKGYNTEQILFGFYYYPSSWCNEKMIKVKGESGRLSYYELSENQQYSLINQLMSGKLLSLFPYQNKWYGVADDMPNEIAPEQWLFIRRSLDLVLQTALEGDEVLAHRYVEKIAQYQYNNCETISPLKLKAERFYNTISAVKPFSMALAVVALVFFVLSIFIRHKALNITLLVIQTLTAGYLLVLILLRWWIGEHIPLSNGFETMLFVSFIACLMGVILNKNILSLFTLLVGAMAMMVASFSQHSGISALVPVLNSPLLSAHVSVIMVSYMLFGVVFFVSLMALLMRNREEELKRISLILLYLGVAALSCGIFLGAIWANVSWGRYWGWDPKEVWALITLFVYALPLHPSLFGNNTKVYHLYCLLALLSVAITYFGVNFILGGLHAY